MCALCSWLFVLVLAVFFVFFVCSSCAVPPRNPSPNPQAPVRPQNKPPRGICVFPTTTVGAHRGAVVALAGLISDGIFIINAGTRHRHGPPRSSLQQQAEVGAAFVNDIFGRSAPAGRGSAFPAHLRPCPASPPRCSSSRGSSSPLLRQATVAALCNPACAKAKASRQAAGSLERACVASGRASCMLDRVCLTESAC